MLLALLARERTVVDLGRCSMPSLQDLLIIRKLVGDAVAKRRGRVFALALARQQRVGLLQIMRSGLACVLHSLMDSDVFIN